MSLVLSPEEIHQFEVDFSYANATRYLSAAGLVLVLYDHLLTFSDEYTLIWKARASFAKSSFLVNRYVVPASLIIVAFEMCGFSGISLSDHFRCRWMLATTSVIGIFSIGIANILVLLRVVLLWENNRTVLRLLSLGFIVSFASSLSLMIVTLYNLFQHTEYNYLVKMCITTETTPTLVGVWACPMFFEILVLGSTCWNAFDRPREANLPLTRALHRDGIPFFVALTLLRTFNLALATTFNPNQTMLGVFFVWAMTTTVLNRSLLRLQRVEVTSSRHDLLPRAASPFGLADPDGILDLDDLDSPQDMHILQPHFPDSRWLGRIAPLPVSERYRW